MTDQRLPSRIKLTRNIGLADCGSLFVMQSAGEDATPGAGSDSVPWLLQSVPVRTAMAVDPVTVADPTARPRVVSEEDRRPVVITARAFWLSGATYWRASSKRPPNNAWMYSRATCPGEPEPAGDLTLVLEVFA